MKTIEEEFPTARKLYNPDDLRGKYDDLRARAVELERENRFLSWQLACAQERWMDARKLEREGAIDGQEIARVMSNQPLSPAPDTHQTKP